MMGMTLYWAVICVIVGAVCADKGSGGGGLLLDLRLPLAGGLAGGISNALLYPIDTIKTMQQSDKSIKGIKSAILKLHDSNGGVLRLYSGFWAAVIGSIPSSAIYFASYETSKRFLFENCQERISRPVIHMLAAASGNIMSSFVFVPKDAIKQQMQAIKTGSIPWARMSPFYSPIARQTEGVTLLEVCRGIMRDKGVKGFYPNYRATLMRNIPSAVIRFTVYEELRLLVKKRTSLRTSQSAGERTGERAGESGWEDKRMEDIGYAVSGGLASAFSSILTTPFDVVKTRLATGVVPRGTPVFTAMRGIVAAEGMGGLFTGVKARVLMSALFGGVGFATFEACKRRLGVVSPVMEPIEAVVVADKAVAAGAMGSRAGSAQGGKKDKGGKVIKGER